MTPQNVLDEAFGDNCVVGGCAAVFQHDVIHHSEPRHQFRPGALREQRTRGIGYLHHQAPIGPGVPAELPDMFGQQGIKMAGHPLRRLTAQKLASVLLRYNFRPRVQES